MPRWPFVFNPKPGNFGAPPHQSAVTLGTGINLVASSTVSVYLPVPRRRSYVGAINIQGATAAAGSGAITAKVIKKAAGTTDKDQCAATSLTNSVVTAEGNFAVAVTAADADRIVNPGNNDTLRVDLVAAGTVTTQFKGSITVELIPLE